MHEELYLFDVFIILLYMEYMKPGRQVVINTECLFVHECFAVLMLLVPLLLTGCWWCSKSFHCQLIINFCSM